MIVWCEYFVWKKRTKNAWLSKIERKGRKHIFLNFIPLVTVLYYILSIYDLYIYILSMYIEGKWVVHILAVPVALTLNQHSERSVFYPSNHIVGQTLWNWPKKKYKILWNYSRNYSSNYSSKSGYLHRISSKIERLSWTQLTGKKYWKAISTSLRLKGITLSSVICPYWLHYSHSRTRNS